MITVSSINYPRDTVAIYAQANIAPLTFIGEIGYVLEKNLNKIFVLTETVAQWCKLVVAYLSHIP